MSKLIDPFDNPAATSQAAGKPKSTLRDPFDDARPSLTSQAEAARRGLETVGQFGEGTVYRDPNSGEMQFVSPGYSTADPAAIKNIMEGREAREDKIGALEGGGRAALQGLSFGTGDEIVAGLASTVGEGDYDEYLARERSKIEDFRGQNPAVAYGSEIVGAIPTAMAAPINAVSKGALLSRLLKAAGVAAGEGTIYGFATGEGGVTPRLLEGAKGAAVSAPIGAAAVPVSAGVRRLADRILTSRAAKQAGMNPAAFRTLSRTVSADDVGPIADNMMLADIGPSARQTLDTAIQTSGPASRIAQSAINDRVTQSGQRVAGAMDDVLGQPQGVRSTARGIADSTRATRSSTYDEAFSKPINYAADEGRRVEEALSRVPPRIMRQAIEEANEDMISRNVRNQQIMADIAEDGTVTFREMPNVQQADAIKRALQTMGRENVDQFGRPTAAGQRAARLGGELRSALGDAVPEYNTAVQAGADKIGMDNALDIGYRALRPSTTREIVSEAVEGMTDAERKMAAQGVRSNIDDALANVKRTLSDPNVDAREATKAIKDLSSRGSREKIALIVGDDQAARLFDEIDAATRAFDLRAAVADNTRTFARQNMNDVIRGQTQEGAVNRLRSGKPLNAGQDLVATLLGRSAGDQQRITDETYTMLVRELLKQGPEAQRVVQGLQQGQSRIGPTVENAEALTQALLRRSAPLAVPATR